MKSEHPTPKATFLPTRTLLLAALVPLTVAACSDDPFRVPSEDPESPPMARSELPIGECDTTNPDWLWCDDFEENRLAGYFGYDDADGSFTRMAGVGVSGGYGMRAQWQEGQVSVGKLQLGIGRNPAGGVGGNVHGNPDADYREVYWRMYVRTQSDWTGGSGWKLSRATVMAGSGWEQAMIAHVWGDDGPELVTDPASGTDPEGRLITDRYNDFDNLRWLGSRRGSTPIFETARSGQWQCVEARASLNTAGRSDGTFQMWINGNLEASRTDINWLGSYDAYGINAVFFENYFNNGSPAAQERYVDNIVVSTAPIGCLNETPVDPDGDVDGPDGPDDGTDGTDGRLDPDDLWDPAGMTAVTDHDFSALDGDGWGYNATSHYSIVQDGTAPRSPGAVGQARYPAGFGGGSGPITTWKSFGGEGFTELRTTQWIKVSDNFFGHPSGVNKVLHFWLDGRNRLYTSMQGAEGGALRPQVRLQAVNEPDDASRLNLSQNVGTGSTFSFRRGEWHKWEIYVRSNTNGGSNGIVKMWVDGQLLAEYTDVNFVPAGSRNHWEHLYWAPTWGGMGSSVPETMYMWTDQLQALGGQGSAGGGTAPDDGLDDGSDGGDASDDDSGDDSTDRGTGDDPGSDDPDGDVDDPDGDDSPDDPDGDDTDDGKKPKKDNGRRGFPDGIPPGFPGSTSASSGG